MAGATQLGVFNKALRWLGERKLASLTENREPLRALNDEWSDAIEFVLYQAYWNFAVRLQQFTPDDYQAAQFGFAFVFTKPDDWMKTFQVSDNEGFEPLLREYADQNNVWFTNIAPIYVKYISKDQSYGLNQSLWTPGFIEYLAAYLAFVCSPRLKQDEKKIIFLERTTKKKKAEAIASDAMDLPPGKPPFGTWVMARAPRGSILPIGAPFGNDAGGSDGQVSISSGSSTTVNQPGIAVD